MEYTAKKIFEDLNQAQKSKVMDYLKTNPTSRKIFRTDFGDAFREDLLRRRDGQLEQHLISNTFGETGSMKSGINIELGCVMDKNFSAEKICFTDQEFLDVVSKAPRQSFVMRDEVTSAGEFGIGSGRMQAFITIQTETLRQSQISIGMISPTEKQLGTAHYILHCIGHNKFRLDKDGYNLDPVYVLVGVMNPATHHYLGSVIFEIDWMSKIWKEYQKKKLDFLKSVKEMDFAKQDYHLLAEKCLQHPNSTYAKTKYDWLVIIQEIVPSMTTDEMMMLYSTIKMEQRKGEF